MLAVLIIMYVFLRYYLDMEDEQLYKYMIVLSIVNIIPILIYTTVSFYTGTTDAFVLLLMAMI